MAKKIYSHLDELKRELKLMQKLEAFAAKKKASQKVIEFIRVRPGWTTPAELAFAVGLSHSINQQLTNLSNDMDALVKASALVK